MHKDLIRARDEFLSVGRVSSDVPPIISESWKRSLSYNVDPYLRKSPEVISPTEIQVLQKSSLLFHAFQTIIPKIESFFNKKYSVILADDKGRILNVYANDGLLDMLKSVNTVPGSVWSEELCGTTAFGTTLVAGKPIIIHGLQHFCETWHIFSCAGIPICHPINKKVIGVLDLTCFPKDFPSNALILTATLAKSIEIEVFGQLQIHRISLENVYLEKKMRISNDLLAAVDTNGQIVRGNDPYTIDHHTWLNQFDWPHFFQTCEAQSVLSSPSVNEEHPLPFLPDMPEGRLQLVYYQNRIIGALIQMRRQPARTSKIHTAEHKQQSSIEMVSLNPIQPTVTDPTSEAIIGESPHWLKLMQKLSKIAVRDTIVLLIGESGTGKEVLARYIHHNSLRKHKPFVTVNCAAFAHDLVASELFGYAPGTFTGGLKEGKKGLFEAANGGTLFLDEIAELPLPTQAMLLRVLQERQVTRIGEYRPRSLDIRVIAATNRDLKQAIKEGKFRLDLYYRLNAVELKVPALRERKEDIITMAKYFLREHRNGPFVNRLMPETVDILLSYDWPGNVRELKNAMEHSAVYSDDGLIFPCHLPEALVKSTESKNESTSVEPITSFGERRLEILDSERIKFEEALQYCRYNVTKTAKRLGISRGTLYKKMKQYQITY